MAGSAPGIAEVDLAWQDDVGEVLMRALLG
jgi:hypothetical protein